MYRRTFLGSIIGSLVAACGFKTAPAKLPVVKFDEHGSICNSEELMTGIPFEVCQGRYPRDSRWWDNYAWKRERLVWVEEIDAVHQHTHNNMSRSSCWGEMLLKEFTEEDVPKGKSLKVYVDGQKKIGRGGTLVRFELKPVEKSQNKNLRMGSGNYWAPPKLETEIMETT